MKPELQFFNGAKTLVVRTIKKPPTSSGEEPSMEVKAEIPLEDLELPKEGSLPDTPIKKAFDSFIGVPAQHNQLISNAKKALGELSNNVSDSVKNFFSDLFKQFYSLAREMYKEVELGHPNIRGNYFDYERDGFENSKPLPGFRDSNGLDFNYVHTLGELENSIELELDTDQLKARANRPTLNQPATHVDASISMTEEASNEASINPSVTYSASLNSPNQPEAFMLEGPASCDNRKPNAWNKILLHRKPGEKETVYLDMKLVDPSSAG